MFYTNLHENETVGKTWYFVGNTIFEDTVVSSCRGKRKKKRQKNLKRCEK